MLRWGPLLSSCAAVAAISTLATGLFSSAPGPASHEPAGRATYLGRYTVEASPLADDEPLHADFLVDEADTGTLGAPTGCCLRT